MLSNIRVEVTDQRLPQTTLRLTVLQLRLLYVYDMWFVAYDD